MQTIGFDINYLLIFNMNNPGTIMHRQFKRITVPKYWWQSCSGLNSTQFGVLKVHLKLNFQKIIFSFFFGFFWITFFPWLVRWPKYDWQSCSEFNFTQYNVLKVDKKLKNQKLAFFIISEKVFFYLLCQCPTIPRYILIHILKDSWKNS